ncbi:hypothetical protein QE152_g32440 [Popillia japonica]|uniref:Uncharacterized protein n=1 Tax=Popillia japonica TaxID=7064 RepID=A0AAW1IZ10_POPJA
MPTKKVDERYCIIILYLIRGFYVKLLKSAKMPTKKVDERYCIIILYLIRGFLHNGDESRSCQRLLPIASVSVSGTPPSNRKHTQEKRAGARYRADKPAIVSTGETCRSAVSGRQAGDSIDVCELR